jgi:hypothetical protein
MEQYSYNKKRKIEKEKKRKTEHPENNSKRRLADYKPHYLENPYCIDIKWDYLKVKCN